MTGQAPACYATDRGEVEASVPNTPIVFEGVEVVSATDVTLRCRVQGMVFTVGALQFLRGTTIHRAGDRGRLVLPRWALRDLGLAEPHSE